MKPQIFGKHVSAGDNVERIRDGVTYHEEQPDHDGPLVGFSTDAWGTLSTVLNRLGKLSAEVTPAEGEPFPARIDRTYIAEGPEGYETWGVQLIPLDRDEYEPNGPAQWHAFETLRSIVIY